LPIELLIYLLISAYVVFLILGLSARARWRDRISPQTYGVSNPFKEGRTLLVVKPSGQSVERGWVSIAGIFAGGVTMLAMMRDEPAFGLGAAGIIIVVAVLILLPWIGLVLSLGHCFTLNGVGITRSSPFMRDRTIEWVNVKSLRYDEMVRGGYVISDGEESLTIDTMVKNGRSFIQFARERIPADAWDQTAIDEAEASLRYSKEAGPHMVRTAKSDRL